LIITILI